MDLIGILKELGAETPFNESGSYTEEGYKAVDKLMRIVDGLDQIGALGKTGDKLEAYIHEIVALEF